MLDLIVSAYNEVKAIVLTGWNFIKSIFVKVVKTSIGFKVVAYVSAFLVFSGAYVSFIIIMLLIGAYTLLVPVSVFIVMILAYLGQMAIYGLCLAVAHECFEIVMNWIVNVSRETVTA